MYALMLGVLEPSFHTIPYHSIPGHGCSEVLRLLDHGRPWVAAQLGPHTWRRNTKPGQVWWRRRPAVMLGRKMPEPHVRSISRKPLTQRRLLIVYTTYAMEAMNLLPKVRQHSFYRLRNLARDTEICVRFLCCCRTFAICINLHSMLHWHSFPKSHGNIPNFPVMGRHGPSRNEQLDFVHLTPGA